MKTIKTLLLPLFMMVGLTVHAQQAEVTKTGGTNETYDVDSVVYLPNYQFFGYTYTYYTDYRFQKERERLQSILAEGKLPENKIVAAATSELNGLGSFDLSASVYATNPANPLPCQVWWFALPTDATITSAIEGVADLTPIINDYRVKKSDVLNDGTDEPYVVNVGGTDYYVYASMESKAVIVKSTEKNHYIHITTDVTISPSIRFYKDGVITKEYNANEVEQIRFLPGQPNTEVKAISVSQTQNFDAATSPKVLFANDKLTFTDNANNVDFSVDEKLKILGVYNLSTGAQSGDDYYGTFSSSHAVQFSDEAVVYAVDVNDDRLIVTEVTSKQVPANTGVLVKSRANSATYNFIASAASIENNLLRPSGDAGITAANMDAANTKFYRLTMHNGTQIGFWWGAENGAAFNLAANKAYLAVPSVSLAKSFVWFDKDDEDAINVVNAEAAKDAIYNLAGQRMNRLQKGINISNNKKIVVR